MNYTCHADIDGTLIYKGKNELGQILTLCIHPDEYNACIFWDVCFWVGKRKKGYQYMQQTGKDGVKSLLWAKGCIVDFIKKHGMLKTSKKNYLCIYWDDRRRKETYYRGLKDLGFKFSTICNQLRLVKTL
jgi:hypothetical protein